MNDSDTFKTRLQALGYTTARPAAQALGVAHTSVWRAWSGKRNPSPATLAKLEALEAEQPAPMSDLARRMLSETDGVEVFVPEPRHNFDLGIDWRPVFKELHETGLITADGDGAPVLTEKGKRAVEFLRERGLT